MPDTAWRRLKTRAATRTVGRLQTLSLRCAALALSALTFGCPPPGKGPTAARGYQDCEPVTAGLHRYFVDHGEYPERLSQLVPKYLPTVPTVTGHELRYARHSTNDYELTFSYGGPGMNRCTLQPDKPWECTGNY